jgi:hypothetical protein
MPHTCSKQAPTYSRLHWRATLAHSCDDHAGGELDMPELLSDQQIRSRSADRQTFKNTS